ncbi:MAG: hypothetical protein Q8Q09_27420 [Deltaproteobacteria bacterium]|nr:hypothetical protein [Deltaproteobacteria bacterium]
MTFRPVISLLVLAWAFVGCGESVAPQVCDGPCVTDAATQPDVAPSPATCPAVRPVVGSMCSASLNGEYCQYGRRPIIISCRCRCFDAGCFWISCDND